MEFKWIRPDNKDFRVIEYTIEAGDPIYQLSLEKANSLAKDMNKNSPSGEVRDENTILANCFAGCITENAVIMRLNDYAEFRKKNIHAKATDFDKKRDSDQIDIIVCKKDKAGDQSKSVTIEVRSSYARVQNNYKRYTEWFSIVGNYVTENKMRELIKDYYITVIFNFSQEEMYEKMISGEPIGLQIAAGCSKECLEEYGTTDDLKNNGAVYKVIKPLVKGFPVNQVMNQIFKKLDI